jgi:hypothetical protein
LLDLNPATVRNWVEDAERADGLRGPASSRSTDSDVRALKRRVAELERANEILKDQRRGRSSTTDSGDRGPHRRVSGPVSASSRSALCCLSTAARSRQVHLPRPNQDAADRRELGKAHLVNALVDLHRANWGAQARDRHRDEAMRKRAAVPTG